MPVELFIVDWLSATESHKVLHFSDYIVTLLAKKATTSERNERTNGPTNSILSWLCHFTMKQSFYPKNINKTASERQQQLSSSSKKASEWSSYMSSSVRDIKHNILHLHHNADELQVAVALQHRRQGNVDVLRLQQNAQFANDEPTPGFQQSSGDTDKYNIEKTRRQTDRHISLIDIVVKRYPYHVLFTSSHHGIAGKKSSPSLPLILLSNRTTQ